MITHEKLLPCPFCGGEAELLEGAPGLYSAENHLYHAKCQSCGASAYDHGRDGAIAAWNRRTPPAAVPDGWMMRDLVWEEIRGKSSYEDPNTEVVGWEAATAFGSYYLIERYFGTDSYGWYVTLSCASVGDYDDPDLAKAAAQADYERRILSALSAAPAAPTEAGNDEHHWNRRTPPAAPEDWVLVPKEPTREMAIAAAKALDDVTVDDPKAAAWDAMRAYRAMLSAAPTPPVDDGWRPIETAPKDGTRFWGKIGDDAIAMLWHPKFNAFVSAWRRMTMVKGYMIDGDVSLDHSPIIEHPEAWMPLPAPPKVKEE